MDIYAIDLFELFLLKDYLELRLLDQSNRD